MTENKLTPSSKNSSTQSINELIENNVKLVGMLSKKYPTNAVERSDLIGAGYIGLVKAAKTYDKDKGYKFSTYATVVILNEIKKIIKKSLENKDIQSIQEIIYYDKNTNNTLTIEETMISPLNIEEMYLEKEEYLILHQAIKKLDKKEQEWIYLYYGFYDRRYTGTEISKIYGINQSTFSKNLTKILKKLREILENEYLITSKKKIYKIDRWILS